MILTSTKSDRCFALVKYVEGGSVWCGPYDSFTDASTGANAATRGDIKAVTQSRYVFRIGDESLDGDLTDYRFCRSAFEADLVKARASLERDRLKIVAREQSLA